MSPEPEPPPAIEVETCVRLAMLRVGRLVAATDRMEMGLRIERARVVQGEGYRCVHRALDMADIAVRGTWGAQRFPRSTALARASEGIAVAKALLLGATAGAPLPWLQALLERLHALAG